MNPVSTTRVSGRLVLTAYISSYLLHAFLKDGHYNHLLDFPPIDELCGRIGPVVMQNRER